MLRWRPEAALRENQRALAANRGTTARLASEHEESEEALRVARGILDKARERVFRAVSRSEATRDAVDEDERRWAALTTALRRSAMWGDTGKVATLLDRGANVNGEYGTLSPLLLAIKHCRPRTVKVLVERGAVVAGISHDGATPILLCAMHDCADAVAALVQAGADTAPAPGRLHGVAIHPIFMAAREGNVRALEALARCGGMRGGVEWVFDANGHEETGWYAIHIASHRGHADVVGALERLGGDVNQRVQDGADSSSLLSSCWFGGGASTGKTPIWIAADAGHTDTVIVLVERGGDVHLTCLESGETAAIVAATNGHTDVVRVLLEAGADLATATDDGSTAMHVAARSGQTDVLSMILEWCGVGGCVDVDLVDNLGLTPLAAAAFEGNAECVEMLIEGGADVTQATNDKETPMTLAFEQKKWSVICKLLDLRSVAMAPEHESSHIAAIEAFLEGGGDICTVVYEDEEGGEKPFVWDTREGPSWGHDRAKKGGKKGGKKGRETAGRTPSTDAHTLLSIAISAQYGETVRVLLAAGAHSVAQYQQRHQRRSMAGTLAKFSATQSADGEVFLAACPHPMGKSYIYYAAEKGYADMIRVLLDGGGDANDGNMEDGLFRRGTAIMIAAKEGHLDAVRVLLAAGADVDVRYRRSWDQSSHRRRITRARKVYRTALSEALEEGHGEVALAIAQTTTVFHREDEIMFQVFRMGAPKHLKHDWVQVGNPSRPDYDLWCAAHNRCLALQPEIIVALVDAGADMEVVDRDGDTVLIAATEREREGVVLALIDKGANVNATRGNSGLTPLHLAETTELVKALIEAGAVCTATDSDGQTPLHKVYDLDIAEMLVKAGADVNTADDDGQTPLFYQAHDAEFTEFEDGEFYGDEGTIECRTDIARFLISECDANVDHVDASGKTILHYIAAAHECTDMLKVVLDEVNDINIIDRQGQTALFIATVRLMNIEVLQCLIDNGGNVNTPAANGKTPLLVAVEEEDDSGDQTVFALLKGGANPAAPVPGQTTAFHRAARLGHYDVVRIMAEINPNPMSWNAFLMGSGTTPSPTLHHGPHGPGDSTACNLPPCHLPIIYIPDILPHIWSFLRKKKYVDLDLRDAHGRTALECALESEEHLVAALLLACHEGSVHKRHAPSVEDSRHFPDWSCDRCTMVNMGMSSGCTTCGVGERPPQEPGHAIGLGGMADMGQAQMI